MADEAVYGTAGVESNKRKYDESPSPVARRVTGFSSPPDSAAPPSSYNSVPPPMSEIEQAKQKAQEIAARLLSNADPSKRARVENGAGVGGGYDAVDAGSGHRHPGLGLSGPPPSASYGYPSSSKKIEIPNGRVGVIIGKGGDTIKYLQHQSGAKIQVTRDTDSDPNSATRAVELMGTTDQIAKAEQMINDVLAESDFMVVPLGTSADTGGSGIVNRRMTGSAAGAEQFVMKVVNNKVGLVIGKGGETIKNMQARTGARIQVIPLHLPPGDMSKERTVQIDGTREQIEAAKQLVEEVTSEELENVGQLVTPTWAHFMLVSPQHHHSGMILTLNLHQPQPLTYDLEEFAMDRNSKESFSIDGENRSLNNRMRNPSMSGGYSQQGYQSRPPTNWNQQGPSMQQPGYGYVQPGAYPGPPQYQQPNYPGYPPTSGGYAASWDQSTAPQNQQTTQGGGYDYYSQQQPPQQQQTQGGPTDGSGYNYSQAQGYSQGQGYGQDGYYSGAAQSGYSQPQTNPSSGYDQQQQGYNAAYGNVSNPAPDGNTSSYGTQTDTNQAPPQPSPNPSYPQQASTQPGYGPQGGYGTQPPSGYGSYGTPQGQKPSGQPAYAQPQQSPSAAQGGGYAQYSQAPPVQPGYAQTDAGAQRPPMSGYQTGYGAQPYGAPPAAQTGYGQQQATSYNSGYGGYSQQAPPPAYSSDVAAAPQSAQPAGAAKASPPS
ncbi:far upstream element-binding protein 1 [Phtheirospermum japonicum]|uniref:Far upstream element-binding protein 1 n=1 Tax=Phtheirospermum japonicum TaxID=374723 RepID=A0A830BPT9_9LAMI|nr:far upstream element-binding protein 1 [Phtheirospermum japonicum]